VRLLLPNIRQTSCISISFAILPPNITYYLKPILKIKIDKLIDKKLSTKINNKITQSNNFIFLTPHFFVIMGRSGKAFLLRLDPVKV
jgi:hypothetical protein